MKNLGSRLLLVVIMLLCCAIIFTQQTYPQGQKPIKFKCKSARSNLKKAICHTVVPAKYREDSHSWNTLELTVRRVDLNADGKHEEVVWESSWAGTSGGSFWVLSKAGRKYTKILETEMSWSPIILLKSKTKGWNNLAYYVQGGGVKPRFVTMAFNRSKYSLKTESEEMPKGTMLIESNWGSSYFGPIISR